MMAASPRRQAAMLRFLALAWLVWLPALTLFAQDSDTDTPAISVDKVLVLGPFDDVIHDQKQADWLTDNLFQTLSSNPWVRAGDAVSFAGKKLTWQEKALAAVSADAGQAVLVALNLDPTRFTEASLAFQWDGAAHMRLGRNKVALAGGPNHSASLKLINQSYQAFLLLQAGEKTATLAEVKLTGTHVADLRAHTQAKHRLSGELLYGANAVDALGLSPDGRYIALTQKARSRDGKTWQRVLEIRNLGSGMVKRAWENNLPGNLAWKSDAKHIAYTLNNQLIHEDVESGRRHLVLENAENVGAIRWVGERLLLQVGIKQTPRGDSAKLFQGLNDRWTYFRSTNQLLWCDPASGWLTPITDAAVSADLADVDANGRILYTTTKPDHTAPPHQLVTLTLHDGNSGQSEVLTEQRSLTGAWFRGGNVLMKAGPNAFDAVGRNIAEGQSAASDYDSQFFLMNPADKQVQALTKDFDPSVNDVVVNRNGRVVFSAYEGDRIELFELGADNSIKKRDNMGDVTGNIALSDQSKPVLVWSASAVQTQEKVFVGGLDGRKPAAYWDPSGQSYDDIQLGEVREWDFKTEDGTEIDGRIYLPNNFDAGKKYPAIVYYYGGVVPVTRGFGGRYPKNHWAGQGYVVYVLQPSGTVGYGQAFSARHLNAWGLQTADDIIACSKAFLDAHDFVDRERVGIIGASYGGFMTMYLTTRTDMFRTSIAHAGISNLTEYWGYGWWGYLYNGVAGRGSFPWNNPELYTEQSPVYAADKVNTPLLLLHGDKDTNVPPSQSHVMYTALKIQDKPVELIEFADEGHHILGWENRLLWWNTILAWFDKDLKDQPEWWQQIYPEPK